MFQLLPIIYLLLYKRTGIVPMPTRQLLVFLLSSYLFIMSSNTQHIILTTQVRSPSHLKNVNKKKIFLKKEKYQKSPNQVYNRQNCENWFHGWIELDLPIESARENSILFQSPDLGIHLPIGRVPSRSWKSAVLLVEPLRVKESSLRSL